MTTQEISSAPRYATLRDYLRVLRRYRVWLVVIALVGAAAGLADALRQKPVYQATSQVAFQDPTQELTIVGIGSPTPESSAQLAEVNVATATSPSVLTRVQRLVHTPASPAALAAQISPQVSLASGLLQITATGSSPALAAELANAVASVLVSQDNQQVRAEFAHIADQIRRRIAHLPKGAQAAGGTLSFYEGELARLEVVGAFAKSATLQQAAQAPSGPSSPHKTRDLALGLILGLLLGIIAAFVRDSMDRRLRNPQDIEASYELPVLGHVREAAMGQVAYLSDSSDDRRRLDLEGFRILRRNLEFLDRPRVIVVTSAVPEEGKTTVASSIAFAMAAGGRNTLLVDADLRRPDLAARLGVERSPGLSEYLEGTATAEQIIRTVDFADPSSQPGLAAASNGQGPELPHRLTIVPSGNPTSVAAERLGSSRFEQFLTDARGAYEMVILDSSPLLPVADTLEIVPRVDAVVLCVREAKTTREQARAAKNALVRSSSHPAGIVVTGLKPQDSEYSVYSYAYDYSS